MLEWCKEDNFKATSIVYHASIVKNNITSPIPVFPFSFIFFSFFLYAHVCQSVCVCLYESKAYLG